MLPPSSQVMELWPRQPVSQEHCKDGTCEISVRFNYQTLRFKGWFNDENTLTNLKRAHGTFEFVENRVIIRERDCNGTLMITEITV